MLLHHLVPPQLRSPYLLFCRPDRRPCPCWHPRLCINPPQKFFHTPLTPPAAPSPLPYHTSTTPAPMSLPGYERLELAGVLDATTAQLVQLVIDAVKSGKKKAS